MKSFKLGIVGIVLLTFFSFQNTFSQGSKSSAMGSVVQLKGKIYDSQTKQQITTGTLRFIEEKGYTVRVTLASDGYTIPISKSGKYRLALDSYIADENSKYLEIGSITEYKEVTKDAYFSPIKVGTELVAFNGFKANDSTFQSSSASKIDEVLDYMTLAKNVVVNVKISLADSKFKAIKVPEMQVDKKGKPKKGTKTISADEVKAKFLAARIASIKKYIESKTERKQFFTYEIDTKSPIAAKGKKSGPVNIRIEVGKIRNV